MKFLETITENNQFKVKVLTMDTISSGRTVTEAYDYHLTRDKVRREIILSQTNNYSDFGCYNLNVA